MQAVASPYWKIWLGVVTLSGFAMFGQPMVELGLQGAAWWSNLRNAATTLAVLLGAHLLYIMARTHWGRRDTAVRPVPKVALDLLRIGLYAVAGLIAVSLFLQEDFSGFLTASGLVIALLGFAIRNVVADIFSGLALGIEAPFRIGDWVTIDGLATGRVQDIGWRTTRLVTSDSTYVILPNSQISHQRITNYSAPRKEYRAHVELTLPVDFSVAAAKTEIRLALAAAELRAQDKGAEVEVAQYNPQGITYRVKYWVPQHDKEMSYRNEIISRIDARLRAQKVRLNVVSNPEPKAREQA